jgi:hypothetical protein
VTAREGHSVESSQRESDSNGQQDAAEFDVFNVIFSL